MLFNIEQDLGDRLVGYLVPDTFSGLGRFRVLGNGEILYEGATKEPRLALVEAGRHESGLCGFDVGPENVANLASFDDLAIVDADSNLLIYRRRPANAIPRKIIRLETHLFPLWRFDDSLRPGFQYFERGIDRHGRETTTQMFLMQGTDSVYLSGRLLFRNFAYYIDSGFDMITVLQNPYVELAERLSVLRLLGRDSTGFLGERDAVRFEPAIRYAKSLDLTDPKRLGRTLRGIEGDVEDLLADPLVRLLTTSTPDEMPGPGCIAGALDVLSNCTIVGLREHFDVFADATAEWLGMRPAEVAAIPQIPRAIELAKAIRESGALDHLVQRDLEVIGHVMQANSKAERFGER